MTLNELEKMLNSIKANDYSDEELDSRVLPALRLTVTRLEIISNRRKHANLHSSHPEK